jgi:hypothetical protein
MSSATARPLSSLWTSVRSQLRDSRQAYAAKASLARELGSYHSASDLEDLHAILDRYNDRQTASIRGILAHQRAASDGRF